MKTKFLFILLLFIPVFFTSCDEEDEIEACEELGCYWGLPSGETGDLYCVCD